MSIVHRLDFFGSEIPYNCFNERVSSLSFTAKLRLRLKSMEALNVMNQYKRAILFHKKANSKGYIVNKESMTSGNEVNLHAIDHYEIFYPASFII